MGNYITTKCGHCNTNLEVLAPEGSSVVGSPMVKCRKCNGLNKSYRKLYRDLGFLQRAYFWTSAAISKVFFGIIEIAAGVGFINNREKLGKLGIIVGSIMFILGLISFYLLYRTKADLKAIEDDFDKNGGFIWGDES